MAYLDENGLEYVLSKLATEGKAKNADHATTAGTASSCSGNAATATTATTATTANKTAGTLTIQGNGTTLTNGTYNGSANKTVNITPGNIGAYTKSEIDSKVSTLNTAIGKKMDDFSIELYNGTGGNPKPVRFATFNYSTCHSEEGIAAKISLVSGHGNGTSYAFLEDAIIRVNYQGNVEVDNFKYYGQDCGTYDGEARQYGDIFWVIDTTNKVVDFYVLMGQYARVQQTPWKRLTYSSKGAVTQYTSCTVYSSGTKVYANNSEIATKNDIPEEQDLSVYAKKSTSLSGYGITDAYTKAQVDSALSGKANSSHGNHVPATQTASNSVFLRNDNTWATVTPGNIGTYTKAEIDSALAGKQAAGSYASSSHTHNYAGSSSAGGAATSANKVNSNLVVKLNGGTTEGTNMFTFNGSGAKTVNITPSSIGAQPAGSYLTSLPSHNHNDLYYTETEIDSKISTLNTAINGKAASSHTHNYAGASSAGGSATSAVKLDTSTAGSATQPVYFSGGKPVACTYTLSKSVPSDAKFTDTTYSAISTSYINGMFNELTLPEPM